MSPIKSPSIPSLRRALPHRAFTTSCQRSYPGFFDLGARAVSRENLHFAKQARATGDRYIEHSPALQLLQSERDLAERRGGKQEEGLAGRSGKKREQRHGYAVFNQEELARRGIEFEAAPTPEIVVEPTIITSSSPSTSTPTPEQQAESPVSAFLGSAATEDTATLTAAQDRLQRAQLVKLSQQVAKLSAQNQKYRAERAKIRTDKVFSGSVFYMFAGVLLSAVFVQCLFILDRNGTLKMGWLFVRGDGAVAGASAGSAGAENVKEEAERAGRRAKEVVANVAERIQQPSPVAVNDASLALNSVPVFDVQKSQSSWLRRLFWKD